MIYMVVPTISASPDVEQIESEKWSQLWGT